MDTYVAVYLRQSRDDNMENYESIESQKGLLINFCKNVLGKERLMIYEDDNISGSTFDRPGLEKMKNDAENGMIEILVIKDLSRLGRNNARTLMYLEYFEELGIRVVTADGRYDSLKDNEMAGIQTWYNELYVKDISRKTRANIKYKMLIGEYIGKAPYGYIKTSQAKNKLQADESKAKIVRMIFNLFIDGYACKDIADMLNKNGIVSPGNTKWNSLAVRRILTNKVYTGDSVQGKTERVSYKSKKARRLPESQWIVSENTHQPIISRETFDKASKIINMQKRTKHKSPSKTHYFKNLLFCGDCGNIMYYRKRANSSSGYICKNYALYGNKKCTSHFIKEEYLINIVSEEILKLYESVDIENIVNFFSGIIFEKAIENLKKLIERKEKQQNILYMDRLEKRISEKLFENMNASIETELNKMKLELDGLITKCEQFKKDLLITALQPDIIRGNIDKRIITLCISKIIVQNNCIVIEFNY